MKKYDVIVIGGGSGGLVAAKLALGFKKKVLLIEKNKIGGECTWTGCVPSKTLIHQARVLHDAQKLKNGVQENVIRDSELIMNHVRATIQKIYHHELPEDLEKSGIDILFGSPEFLDKRTILCNGSQLTADKCIIATGSSPFVPTLEGIENVPYLTNQTLFDLKKLPKSLLILGGGPIGIELASALNRLGVHVTVIERQSWILSQEDKELVVLLTQQLVKEGVEIQTSMQALRVKHEQRMVALTCTDGKQEHEFKAESLLIAVGRRPNIEGLALEKAGVQYTKKGINVTSTLQTTTSTIYAVGDVVGPYQFTHMANYQAQIATRNACIPFIKKKYNYSDVVWVTFTDPEFAHAGMTEEQAKEKYGDHIKIYRAEYANLDRALIEGKEFGMAKFICDKQGKLVGAHILGERAGELIHEVQIGKKLHADFSKFFSVIHAYPTYSELIWQASKTCYIDEIRNNFFVKMLQKFF